jgi:hypothetical protein
MAQIRIEQRRTGLGWLWLLIALIILAIIIWFVASRRNAATGPASQPANTPSSLESPNQPTSAAVMPLAAV